MLEGPTIIVLSVGDAIRCRGWVPHFTMLLGVTCYSLIRGSEGMVISIIIFSCE